MFVRKMEDHIKAYLESRISGYVNIMFRGEWGVPLEVVIYASEDNLGPANVFKDLLVNRLVDGEDFGPDVSVEVGTVPKSEKPGRHIYDMDKLVEFAMEATPADSRKS